MIPRKTNNVHTTISLPPFNCERVESSIDFMGKQGMWEIEAFPSLPPLTKTIDFSPSFSHGKAGWADHPAAALPFDHPCTQPTTTMATKKSLFWIDGRFLPHPCAHTPRLPDLRIIHGRRRGEGGLWSSVTQRRRRDLFCSFGRG